MLVGLTDNGNYEMIGIIVGDDSDEVAETEPLLGANAVSKLDNRLAAVSERSFLESDEVSVEVSVPVSRPATTDEE